jgi:vanillate monooxygenase ferredoxin subunit
VFEENKMIVPEGLVVRVAGRFLVAREIVLLELVAADGSELPPFDAGAHINVKLPGRIERQYSLCSNPAERYRYVLGVLHERASRGGSKSIHTAVSEGDLLTISAPRNMFQLEPSAKKSILIGGGIGVTPLLSMAYSLSEEGRDFLLHYTARSHDRLAFLDRLNAPPLSAFTRLYSDDSAEKRFDASLALGAPQPGCHVYVCGPGGFIDHVVGVASGLGWSNAHIHTESFTSRAVTPTGNRPFELVIASTGQVLHVPADRSVASVLGDHGLAPPLSCEQGICGTCVTTVLKGQPEHRDSYLSEADKLRGDCFTPCCSRAVSDRLELDL